MDGYDFRELLYSLGIIHLDQLADQLQLSPITLKRYTTPGYKVPMHSVAAVILLSGRIGHKRWDRWKFNNRGQLIDPWGNGYWPDEIANIQIYRNALRAAESLEIESKNVIDSCCYQNEDKEISQQMIGNPESSLV